MYSMHDSVYHILLSKRPSPCKYRTPLIDDPMVRYICVIYIYIWLVCVSAHPPFFGPSISSAHETRENTVHASEILSWYLHCLPSYSCIQQSWKLCQVAATLVTTAILGWPMCGGLLQTETWYQPTGADTHRQERNVHRYTGNYHASWLESCVRPICSSGGISSKYSFK